MKLNRLNKTASLPNGLRVHYVSPPDVQFLYGEIFDDEAYLKHGVTIEPDDVVIDVGANIGMFAMYAARKCHRGRVFSFEPIPPTYQTLRRNVRENLGCAEGVGVSTFVSSGDQTTSCAADFERRSSADDAVAFEAYPCANNSLDDADFADVAGRQLRSVKARHPSESAPDGGSVFNLGDWDAVAAAREKDDDDAPVVTAVGGEIFERVVSPGEEDNEQRGAEYRSSSSKRRAHPGGGRSGGGSRRRRARPRVVVRFVVYEKKIERRDSGLVVVFSVVSAFGGGVGVQLRRERRLGELGVLHLLPARRGVEHDGAGRRGDER